MGSNYSGVLDKSKQGDMRKKFDPFRAFDFI